MSRRLAISSALRPEARRKALSRLPISSKRRAMTQCFSVGHCCFGELGRLPPPPARAPARPECRLLWGRVGEGGYRNFGVCRYPPPCPSPDPKSDISDFGNLKRPNSGKPELGWGEGTLWRQPWQH